MDNFRLAKQLSGKFSFLGVATFFLIILGLNFSVQAANEISMNVINPYQGVNWGSVKRISSATHMHVSSQSRLDTAYKYGIRFFPNSNYYPSAPYDTNTRSSDFKLRQWWPIKRNGVTINPPINWNTIITWQNELQEPSKSNFPFVQTGRVFSKIPANVVFSPNAEHHGFTNSSSHITSPGSRFASGNFEGYNNQYLLQSHGFPVGFGGTWQDAFKGMLDSMVYSDGGGIIINHPGWFSQLTDAHVLQMLDFDKRVLGIEIYNHTSINPAYKPPLLPEEAPGFNLNLWDRILATGRKCWGFCVPDHGAELGNWLGRSVLLVPQFTEHDCLKAYRSGCFYGAQKDNALTLTNFAVTASAVSVSVNSNATFKFITEKGLVKTTEGLSATCNLPQKDGLPDLKFMRVEITDNTGERLFLQPVMWTVDNTSTPTFKSADHVDVEIKKSYQYTVEIDPASCTQSPVLTLLPGSPSWASQLTGNTLQINAPAAPIVDTAQIEMSLCGFKDTLDLKIRVYDPTSLDVKLKNGNSAYDIYFIPNIRAGIIRFTAETDAPGEIEIALYNLAGKMIGVYRDMPIRNGKGNYEMEVDKNIRINNGTYFVKMKQGDREINRKFVAIK